MYHYDMPIELSRSLVVPPLVDVPPFFLELCSSCGGVFYLITLRREAYCRRLRLLMGQSFSRNVRFYRSPSLWLWLISFVDRLVFLCY